MQGLEAISAQNGWAMAVAGACIVMTGLATLSIIISQLHKVIRLVEKREPDPVPAATPAAAAEVEPAPGDPLDVLEDLHASARAIRAAGTRLAETFSLVDLYQLLKEQNDPHPHITIRELRGAGLLVPTGDGSFSWSTM